MIFMSVQITKLKFLYYKTLTLNSPIFQVEHQRKHGGLLRHATDLYAHYQSAQVFCLGALEGWSRSRKRSKFRGVIRPVLDAGKARNEEHRTIQNSMERGRVRIVDENEQELIYREISARNELLAGKNRVVDKMIDAKVLQSLKKDRTKASISRESAEALSRACRNLVSPLICSKVILDFTRLDGCKRIMRQDAISKRLSAIYFEILHRLEEARFVRDLVYGPQGSPGVEAYRAIIDEC